MELHTAGWDHGNLADVAQAEGKERCCDSGRSLDRSGPVEAHRNLAEEPGHTSHALVRDIDSAKLLAASAMKTRGCADAPMRARVLTCP